MRKLTRSLALALVPFALVAAGCGSDDDGDTATATATAAATSTAATDGASSQAADAIAEIVDRPTQIPQDAPLEGEFPTGKTIDYLQCGVPACAKLGTYLKAATDAVGWKLNVVNIGGTPEEVKAGFEKAVRDAPDAVVTTGGWDRAIYGDELAALEKAGIPLVAHSEAIPAAPEDGVISVVSGPERHTDIGTAWADWIAEDSGGSAKVLFIDSGFPVQGIEKAALESELAAVCPDCEMESYQAPIESIGKDLPGKIAQQLQSAPDTTHLVVGFGDMAIGLPAAMAGAGIGDLPILTQEPADANLQDMRNGDLTVMHNGSGPESMWGIVDALAREFNGEEYDAELPLPRWVITEETLPEGLDWPTVEDYQAQFKELWGL